MDDLCRTDSEVLDRVIADCMDLSLQGRRYIEVSVKMEEGTNEDEGRPVSFGVDLVYETTRFDNGLEKHPIKRKEMLADLCLDPNTAGYLDNPGFMTKDHNVMTEARMQILLRLQNIVALQRAGIVGKVWYQHAEDKPRVEVTDDVLRALSGGMEAPSKAHVIYDNFSV